MLALLLAGTSGNGVAADDGSAGTLSALRPASVAGFPVQRVDVHNPASAAALETLASATIPDGLYFGSLQENRHLCAQASAAGLGTEEIKQGAVPPAAALKAWLQDLKQLRDMAAFCPQLVLRLLLLYVELVIASPATANMVEASKVHMQYNVLSKWLQHVAFEGEQWEDIAEGWGFAALEARIFVAYKRLMSGLYNNDPAAGEEEGAPAATSMQGAELQEACPHMQGLDPELTIQPVLGESGTVLAIEGPVPISMRMLGNALSLYWQARGLAAVLGTPFTTSAGRAEGFFVQHLPRKVRTEPADVAPSTHKELKDICAPCRTPQHWRWPHLCLGPWSRILPQIRADTQSALRASGAEARVRQLLQPRDVAIHLRCFPFFTDSYPLAGFSLYSTLAEHMNVTGAFRFFIVAGALGPSCHAVALALDEHLRQLYPTAAVVRRFTTTARRGVLSEDLAGVEGADAAAQDDFSLLVFVPTLIRTPGSFSLWAAVARSEGAPVITTPNLLKAEWEWATADFGAGWHWRPAPLLTEDVAKFNGFVFDDPRPWIDWLKTH
eukprot:TRINITY_DN81751_c0_g1_i1.p1 TRINITY_DN81751_c0_g1~~TRINITY_DN81751_c0_g1_i1.p1  ORF type:complete len:554 (-),score=112.74 TRINITY_DN81751_c0_g1_i1:791-2452(-)